MSWLSSLPSVVLLAGWMTVALATAWGGRRLARWVVPGDEHQGVPAVAAPLMPALGATFAVLMALTLASEVGYLKSAQDVVAGEAAAASRLAWASTSPGVDGAPIRAELRTYLSTTRAGEWDGDAAARGRDDRTSRALAGLERTVRTEAARTELGTPVSSELLAALDGVTSGRRVRLADAGRSLPVLYVVTLVASGVALVLNAGALAMNTGRRSALLVGGLAAVVGLSLALLFSLTAPWRGGLVVSGDPLDDVVVDLDDGYFTR